MRRGFAEYFGMQTPRDPNGEYHFLPRIKIFELFEFFHRENRANDQAVALREITVTAMDRLRTRAKERGEAIGYTALIAKAAAMVLQEMPHLNRIAIEWPLYTRIVELHKAHVSVAVERTDARKDIKFDAAFIFTVYDVAKKTLKEIATEIEGLATVPMESKDRRLERWRLMLEGTQKAPFQWIVKVIGWFHKNLPSSYIKNRGGSVIISSPSKYGVDFVVAHWPYTIGLSFGLAKDRPWVENGELVVRKTMMLTMAFDRRLITGSGAAKFINRLSEILETADTSLAIESRTS